ncbi:glycosyltransferase [Variovorax sp. RTB1]|uniref:glycosyltransferase n=1 Tax=Variovorax sp. RTB1 TaxID=3048631 RepID=UPI002B22A374|nr:glycosyltransferase [Variovorax sp. RTB1]
MSATMSRGSPLRIQLERVYRYLGRLARQPKASGSQAEQPSQLIEKSGLFDPVFYALAYPDVRLSELSPLEHFIQHGLMAGRHPSIQFDPDLYAASNPDIGGVRKALLHYVLCGRLEGRIPGPAPFAADALATIVAEVRASGMYDEAVYRGSHPAIDASEMDPLVHYLVSGYRDFVEPSNACSTRTYLGRYVDVRMAGINPLVHWLRHGRQEGRKIDLDPLIRFPWSEDDRGYHLPDDVVSYEISEGEAYFGRMGFDFADRDTAKGLTHAADFMANQRPLLDLSADAPDVTIIIPVYGQAHFALSCLDSLVWQRSKFTAEIIIADDASPAKSETELLGRIPWVRYERRDENGGFLDCCNWAVEKARGKFVVLLNSDTRVVEGWLDELINGFALFPKAGMVGSKLLNDDGSLQEAGGIFWRDGSAHNYGRGGDSNKPEFCFARQADFISGASIALRKSVWDELSGFDPYYRPAYCEDADLAFRLRRAGYEVWFVPFSRVIHYEGVTHGRDTTKGVKAYQVENLKKFGKRFQAELVFHPEPGSSSVAAASWRMKRHLLVIDAQAPAPDQDSGSVVTDEVMRTYRELGFSEHFFANHHPYWSEPYVTALQRKGVCCHYVPFASHIGMLLESGCTFDYALLYRYYVADMVHDEIRARSPATRILFANVDLHYLRESRAATTASDKQALLAAALTKKRELEMFARVDASFVHTEVEKNIIQAAMPRPLENIVVLPWLAELSDGDKPYAKRTDVMFLGNFPHTPNVDSIRFFMESIWPRLERSLPPYARLLVVGNKPPQEVMSLSTNRVIVTGYVEELAPYFATTRVFVAPLRYGAGIKGKLVTALAHGVPSVATRIAAEGIGAEGCAHLAVADDPDQFADEVLRIYGDESAWTALRDAGLEFVRANYSRQAASQLCVEAMRLADETWARRQEYMCRSSLEKIMSSNGEYDGVSGQRQGLSN